MGFEQTLKVAGDLRREGSAGLPLYDYSSKTSSFAKFSSLPLATRTALLLTLSTPLYSLVSPIPIAPITPAYFLRSTSKTHFTLEVIDSLLSPFLVSASFVSVLLSAANLRVFHVLDLSSPLSGRVKLWSSAFIWVGIVSFRVTAAYVFGRAFGWGHPRWMASVAIHEVGQGESIVSAFRQTTCSTDSNPFPFLSYLKVSLLFFSSWLFSSLYDLAHFSYFRNSPSYTQALCSQQNTVERENDSAIAPYSWPLFPVPSSLSTNRSVLTRF